MIDTTKYTAHQHPGKFEGETAATEYFYEQVLEGNGETLERGYPNGEDDFDVEEVDTVFQITAEEAEAFGLSVGAYFVITEDSQGFVYGNQREINQH
jgi:hypothetical protein